MIQSAHSNISSGIPYQARPTADGVNTSNAALSMEAAPAPAHQTDLSAISSEGRDGEGTSDRVDNLLQGMQSWGDSSEEKAEGGEAKQIGSFFSKLWEARNHPAVRRTQGAAANTRRTTQNRTRCERIADDFTAVGSGVGLIPGPVGVAGRGAQGVGGFLSLVGCPVLQSQTVQQFVRRVDDRIQEGARGATEMVYGQDYDQNGTPDWIEGNRD